MYNEEQSGEGVKPCWRSESLWVGGGWTCVRLASDTKLPRSASSCVAASHRYERTKWLVAWVPLGGGLTCVSLASGTSGVDLGDRTCLMMRRNCVWNRHDEEEKNQEAKRRAELIKQHRY